MSELFTRARLLRLLVLFCAFAVAAAGQHWFVHRQIYRETEEDLGSSAADIKKDMTTDSAWDLRSIRQTGILEKSWYLINHDGMLVDVEDTVPGLFHGIVLEGVRDTSPRTALSSVNEKWRLLAKRLDSGIAIVGIPDVIDTKSADEKLRATLAHIGPTLIDARHTRPSSVDLEVHWAVIDEQGNLVAGLGGIPMKTDPRQIPVPTDKEVVSTLTRGKSTFQILSSPVVTARGDSLGTILVPVEISSRLRTLGSLDRFNLAIATGLLVVSAVWALFFAGHAWWRDRTHPSVAAALQTGETKTIEFKASYCFDIWTSDRNVELRFNVLRAIAGFLNSDGGTLFIGIEELKSSGPRLRGLEGDLALFDGSRDKLRLDLANLISTQINHEVSRSIADRIENHDGQACWVVEVRASRGPAFVRRNNHDHFYVREGPKTNELQLGHALAYIKSRWN